MSTSTTKPDEKVVPRTVVLVDNDELLLEAIGEVLRNKGFEVHVARDGLEALQVIRSVKPSFVILDIILPKIDGGRVCWLIRQDREIRDTPIIAFSGLAPQDFRRFPELSADAYVAKGPLTVVTNNILMAIKFVEEKGRGDFASGIFGYEGFRPRQLISEMVFLKRHYETLMRTINTGVLELDPDGRILMANAAAGELLGKKEVRLVADSLPSLFPARERRVIQEILDDLRKTRASEPVRVTIPLGGKDISFGFCCTVEDGECTSILVNLERVHSEIGARK
jgi:CheY-like chemotaxis protein